MNKFVLDPTLEKDTFYIADLTVSRLLLMNDARYPWLILVPRRADKVEIIDLTMSDQIELLKELNVASTLIKNVFKPDKINIANIGNRVPALHIHVIARYKTDGVWPAPVWGLGEALPYSSEEKEKIIKLVREALDERAFDFSPS